VLSTHHGMRVTCVSAGSVPPAGVSRLPCPWAWPCRRSWPIGLRHWQVCAYVFESRQPRRESEMRDEREGLPRLTGFASGTGCRPPARLTALARRGTSGPTCELCVAAQMRQIEIHGPRESPARAACFSPRLGGALSVLSAFSLLGKQSVPVALRCPQAGARPFRQPQTEFVTSHTVVGWYRSL
jgi:hypothetical protein